LQAQKSEAQTYTSSPANQACKLSMHISNVHRCNRPAIGPEAAAAKSAVVY
jgi:hypothetical protein